MADDSKVRNLWTREEIHRLKELVERNTPMPDICHQLGRSVSAVYRKASDQHISLRAPTSGDKKTIGS